MVHADCMYSICSPQYSMGALLHADCTVLVVFSARLHVTEFIKKLPQHKTYVSLCVFHDPVFERGGDFYSNIQFCRAKGMCLELNYTSPLPYRRLKSNYVMGVNGFYCM